MFKVLYRTAATRQNFRTYIWYLVFLLGTGMSEALFTTQKPKNKRKLTYHKNPKKVNYQQYGSQKRKRYV